MEIEDARIESVRQIVGQFISHCKSHPLELDSLCGSIFLQGLCFGLNHPTEAKLYHDALMSRKDDGIGTPDFPIKLYGHLVKTNKKTITGLGGTTWSVN